MLAYILAIAVALGSFGFYITAFFFPELHRKSDFLWSGVGLFYALVLWVCAGRITGGVLLGQLAGVALLGWFGWQTLTLRKELTSPAEQTEVSLDVQEKLKTSPVGGFLKPITSFWGKKKPEVEATIEEVNREATTPETKVVTSDAVTTDKATESFIPTQTSATTTTEVQTVDTAKENIRYPQVEMIDNQIGEVTQKSVSSELVTPEPPSIDNQIGEVTQKSESPELVAPEPPPAEVVEAATKVAESKPVDVVVEEIAPEVVLAPPAEPPGDGSPEMRQNPTENTTGTDSQTKPENPAG